MASVCCVTAFAASSVDGDMMNESTLNEGGIIRDKVVDESNVIYVGGLLEDGTVEEIGGDESFADGWNAAVKYAKNGDWLDEKGYERIVVDLRADWTASKGKFGSGDGFSDGAKIGRAHV